MTPRPDAREHGMVAVEDTSQRLCIDRAHLARQTLGDAELEREVLGMFVAQLEEMQPALTIAAEARRARLAHALVGAARGVGAFALADCAGAIEREPADQAALARFAELADEVRAQILSLHGQLGSL